MDVEVTKYEISPDTLGVMSLNSNGKVIHRHCAIWNGSDYILYDLNCTISPFFEQPVLERYGCSHYRNKAIEKMVKDIGAKGKIDLSDFD